MYFDSFGRLMAVAALLAVLPFAYWRSNGDFKRAVLTSLLYYVILAPFLIALAALTFYLCAGGSCGTAPM